LIGYSWKSVDDYYSRIDLFNPVLNDIDHYYTSLSPEQKPYNYCTLLNPVCDSIINNQIIVHPANLDNKCYLSTIVFIIDKVCIQFGLTLEQYIELVYVFGLVSDPVARNGFTTWKSSSSID
jgi:hypothetical protein